jgi:hypothetical protein
VILICKVILPTLPLILVMQIVQVVQMPSYREKERCQRFIVTSHPMIAIDRIFYYVEIVFNSVFIAPNQQQHILHQQFDFPPSKLRVVLTDSKTVCNRSGAFTSLPA